MPSTIPRPLKKNIPLIQQYKEKLINGTISDAELQKLANSFSPSKKFNSGKPYSEDNHTKIYAMQNFIQIIGSSISQQQLHTLNNRLVETSPKSDSKTFLRGNDTTFTRAMLAYEKYKYSEASQTHYKEGGAVFNGLNKSLNACEKFQSSLLTHIVKFFKQAISETQPVLAELKNYYSYVSSSPKEGRLHFFSSTSAKEELKNLKGDHLKSEILKQFKTGVTGTPLSLRQLSASQ